MYKYCLKFYLSSSSKVSLTYQNKSSGLVHLIKSCMWEHQIFDSEASACEKRVTGLDAAGGVCSNYWSDDGRGNNYNQSSDKQICLQFSDVFSDSQVFGGETGSFVRNDTMREV